MFAFVGAQLKRPLVIGLVFAFGWEQAILVLPGYLRKFTVAYYLQALVPHAMPQDSTLSMLQAVFRDSPSFVVCLACLLAFLVGFLYLAAAGGRAAGIRARAIRRKAYGGRREANGSRHSLDFRFSRTARGSRQAPAGLLAPTFSG